MAISTSRYVSITSSIIPTVRNSIGGGGVNPSPNENPIIEFSDGTTIKFSDGTTIELQE